MSRITLFIFTVFTLISASMSGQVAGNLDVTFNTTGKVVYDKDLQDLYTDVKVQTDGRIVAVGISYTPTYSSVIEVTRYLADGSFDPSFGTNGHYNYSLNAESGAYKCLIRDDGRILVCGYTTDYTTWSILLIQLKADGTPDPAFGTNGIVLQNIRPGEEIAYALAQQNDGKILVAGYIQDTDFRNAPVVLRFSETGTLDTSFGTGGVATVPITETDNDFSAVSLQSDGKILAAGHISNGMSWFSLLIARFDQDGQVDATYGTGGVVNMNLNNVDDEFFDMQVTADNETYLTGFTVSPGDYFYHLLMMKFDIFGQPVTAFGTNGTVVYGDVPYTFGDAMVLQTDGKILIAGCTGDLQPANNDWAVWRFNANGSADNSFGTNGVVTTDFFGNSDEALGIALHGSGIIVAGKTRNATDYLDFAVARYLNDAGVSVPEATGSGDFSVSPNPVKKNGTVTLTYNINQAEKISIELLSVTGAPVMKVQTGMQSAGNHSVSVAMPAGLSGGVYYFRITGSQSESGIIKVIVLD